jgi:hypothetical protein
MEVISNPYEELPIRNDKYAALCTELHLGHRHLTHLGSLYSKFINLSILWLNNNNLTDIRGLDDNIRLKYLYLHENRIQSLSGSSLSQLSYLETLTLNGNQLLSLEEVLQELKYLRSLKTLDLFDNPISQEDNYRLLVLSEMPWLQSLDRQIITKKELKESKKLKLKLKKLNNMKLSSDVSSPEASSSSSSSPSPPSSQQLQPLFQRISQLFQLKRIFFQDICLEYDPRRLGLISVKDFTSCLVQFNILSQFTDEEYHSLLQFFLLPTQQTPTHHLTMTSTLKIRISEPMVNYELFCRETLPKPLQHTKKKLATMTINGTSNKTITEKNPEISLTVKDLICTVKNYQQEEKKREERIKRETILNLSSASSVSHTMTGTNLGIKTIEGTRASTSPQIGSGMAFSSQSLGSGSGGLDPWLIGQLRSILTEIALRISVSVVGGGGKKRLTLPALCQETSPEIQLTESDVLEVLSRMRDLGKTISQQDFLSQIFKQKLKISLKDLCQIFELDISSTATATNRPTTPSKKKQSMRVEWRDLSGEERRQLEEEEFSLARGYLDHILRGADRNPASTSTPSSAPAPVLGKDNKTESKTPSASTSNNLEAEMRQSKEKGKDLFQLTFQKSINGTRMAATSLCHSPRSSSRSTPAHHENDPPHRIISTAPNRSDIIVIPSLNSASLRQQQQQDLQRDYNWQENFLKLGLKKERLEIALRRKERSLTSGRTVVGLPSSSSSSSSSLALPPAVGPNASASVRMRGQEGMSQRVTETKHGWGNTTGTLVFK